MGKLLFVVYYKEKNHPRKYNNCYIFILFKFNPSIRRIMELLVGSEIFNINKENWISEQEDCIKYITIVI